MKASELRIGNHVYNENKHIVEVNATRIMFCQDNKCNYEPIPLTEELLLKCVDFKLEHLDTHFVTKGHTIWICNDMFLCEKNGFILKYLHQLQNLYFALTNNELNIEL